MAAQLGRFQVLEADGWKGLTTENHIGAIYRSAPQLATNTIIQLLANYRGKTLETWLNQFPVKYFDTDDEYYWEVIGSSRRNIPLVEARRLDGSVVEAGQANVGVRVEPFFLVFPEDWFHDGEVLAGEQNEAYPLVIKGEPVLEGTNAVYKVELMGNITNGMPVEELLSGKRFSWEYAPVESRGSRRVGGVRYTTPVALRNEFSHIRIHDKIYGDMYNKKLLFGLPGIGDGGERVNHTMWMHHADWVIEQTFAEYKANAIMYGRSNRNDNGQYMNFGKSGNVIKMGAGLREQMEYGNTYYYNPTDFELRILEDALFELSTAKLGFQERRFVLRTGERGAALFSKAVLSTVSGWAAFQYAGSTANNPPVIQRVQSELHSNALSAGFQFVEFRAPNGIVMTVEVDPMYDDPVRNKIYSDLGGPAMSYRMDILEIGTMDQPNIQLTKVRGNEEVRGWEWGLRNPYTGEWGNPYMSHDEDSADFHKMAILGVMVLDPTRIVSLIPQDLLV